MAHEYDIDIEDDVNSLLGEDEICRICDFVLEEEGVERPCMVSVEGVCAAWYKYGQGRFEFGK